MADTEPKRKSGRTPEQQAARDARKAAKKAAAEAEAAAAGEAEATTEEAGEKRKRPTYEEDELLEVDLTAGAPLSKAEARAAKKRAKLGQAPVQKKAEYEKKAKAIDAGAEGEGEGEGEASGDGEARPRKVKEKGKEEKGEYSVWIGNMSFRTQPDALKAWLENGIVEQGGEPDCVTRVYLPKKAGRGEFSENKG